MALEHDRRSALGRFAHAVEEASGLPDLRVQLSEWEEAPRVVSRALVRAGHRTLVIDEVPYLLRHSPELPSVLQAVCDERRDDPGLPPLRILLCGSAISVMEELPSGSGPLRGRTQLELRLKPFDYRTSARYWGAEEPELAFLTDAVFGGTAGYRDLVQVALPQRPEDFPGWLSDTVLNPVIGALHRVGLPAPRRPQDPGPCTVPCDPSGGERRQVIAHGDRRGGGPGAHRAVPPHRGPRVVRGSRLGRGYPQATKRRPSRCGSDRSVPPAHHPSAPLAVRGAAIRRRLEGIGPHLQVPGARTSLRAPLAGVGSPVRLGGHGGWGGRRSRVHIGE